MKSDDITIQQLFQDRRQYMVPFYQRAYVWTLSNQWDQLWEDICAKADARLAGNKITPHFLGAVVLDPQPRAGLIGVDTLHIIDGQQRLTTLQFILKSILLALGEVDAKAISEIISGTLANSNPDTMRDPEIEKFKVWPTFRDRKNHIKAFNANRRDDFKSIFPNSFTQNETLRKIGIRHPAPLEAIWFFSDKFKKWICEGGESEIGLRSETLASSVLQDLKVVSIVLDEDDDAQVIFETLNGRGAQLHATDLIRNFIFMRADREGSDSETLYNEFWSNFETTYWNSMQRRGRMKKLKIEWFIHAYLQAVMGEEVDLGRLYFEYRRYVFNGNEPKKAEPQLSSLSDYSNIYQQLLNGEGINPIAKFGRRIEPYEVTTIHPLALLIAAFGVSDDEKERMFNLLLSFIVRRAICGLTQKNYNNVFLSILRNLSKEGVGESNLRKILLSPKSEGARWPRDEEFINSCTSSNLYPGKLDAKKMRAILAELEYQIREDARAEDFLNTDLGHLDIDHILPKSWYKHWSLPSGEMAKNSEPAAINLKKMIGEELTNHEQEIVKREELIKTLGNLTLLNLSVNREAQNKGFPEKKQLLLQNTNLRLNVSLLGLDDWDEGGIINRSKKLAKAAIKVWPGEKAEQIAPADS
ncbi:DUF262 domain-containing protein [Candidatus Falkowbacteria bacterium]|nr:DUF262 domain-containing protein [Bacteroidota bacterium]MBT5503061.1 DUF262 domain-containing protein [Candidatus Falkowbacteria bacterium]MBT6757375.1 DUF262 domain-containing protein [Candidatus Jacksonbacteria bacterium]